MMPAQFGQCLFSAAEQESKQKKKQKPGRKASMKKFGLCPACGSVGNPKGEYAREGDEF